MPDITIPVSLDYYATVDSRIDRADRHVHDLRILIDSCGGRAYTREVIEVIEVIEVRPGRLVERAELVEQLPIEAAMVLSDAVHQARASLDNLVTALRGVGNALPDHERGGGLNDVRATALRGVPHWAVDVIRRMQPWANGIQVPVEGLQTSVAFASRGIIQRAERAPAGLARRPQGLERPVVTGQGRSPSAIPRPTAHGVPCERQRLLDTSRDPATFGRESAWPTASWVAR